MNVHFIAIGGSAMHNLALTMHKKGYNVTGSDDEVFEPSKTRLKNAGILPEVEGWFPEKLNKNIDAVILGMHARADNPELAKAKELGLKIFSYPEYIYEQTKNKTRVVVGGSHGKTTITAMILHVLNFHKIDCDYMVGAQLAGFDTMVKLSEEAKIAVIEGDEYLSSPIDRRPKFHLYKPNIAILSGIAWDHINVFPTFDNYVEQFRIFVNLISENGALVYCEEDAEVKKVAEKSKNNIKKIPYSVPEHMIENGITYLLTTDHGPRTTDYGLQVFGKHNLMNLNGARLVCNQIGVSDEMFYEAIQSFKGASNRLELLFKNDSTTLFRDFAHSPSKLKATTAAVKEQYPNRKLIACMELHTFSSLNENFLAEYKGAMDKADVAIVYYNPHTIEHKKLKPIIPQQVKDAFARNDLQVFTNSQELMNTLKNQDFHNTNLLLMSSGNYDGVDVKNIAAIFELK
ncbi:MAG: UDP-N-acetylmuramate--L-alanyl-gamma-D-glutamyl-meso-2,6-diaminoheptandioate ligase [Bacteroidia bacterium]|nr:UDP-N-acetylmuramate--L-alanyl-gamma-D-glutamyl-meso-2,6-diaminoheptandioate ligase [Bacteroidia bacterium]